MYRQAVITGCEKGEFSGEAPTHIGPFWVVVLVFALERHGRHEVLVGVSPFATLLEDTRG